MNRRLTLLELNNHIRDVLQDNLESLFWVIGEISEIKVNRAGHCYLELVEKEPGSDEIAARARATIWSYTYRMIKPYFLTTTGQELTDGLKILVQVSVEFHPVYGLSLNIRDIDPSYTLGDLVKRRREIIEKLKAAGVFDMNRELTPPLVPQRIAVISSATAAGYQDFVTHLEANPGHFRFYHTLYQASMQGADAVPSILEALNRIFEDEENFDAVAIIRGGGAQADLSCFDNFDLAWTVAQFPLPVITGIGHEKDDTIIDLVAFARTKTPTAAAEFFIAAVSGFYDRIISLQDQVVKCSREILADHSARLKTMASALSRSTGKNLQASRLHLERTGQRYKNGSNRFITARTEGLIRYSARLIQHSSLIFLKHKHHLNRLTREIRFMGKTILVAKNSHLRQLHEGLPSKIRSAIQVESLKLSSSESALRLLDPQNVLQRGFTITMQNRQIIKSATGVSPEIPLETHFHDGKVFSKIQNNPI